MSQKLASTVVILILTLNTINSAFVNDHEHHKDSNNNRQSSPVKHTIEELLTTVYPYKDPRTDHQVDMDPCKSGKVLHYSTLIFITNYIFMFYVLCYIHQFTYFPLKHFKNYEIAQHEKYKKKVHSFL